MSETVIEAQKTVQETAELLHNLLVGMENLGENVKQLREEVNNWGEPEGQEILDDLMKEVPLISSASEQPQVSSQTPAVNLQIPPITDQILSNPASGSISVMYGPSLREMQERLTALMAGPSEIHVSESGAQGNVQFSAAEKYYTPASATLPYPGLDGHPRRITPIPVSVTMRSPAVTLIERLENEKKQQEELGKELERRHIKYMDDS